MKSLRYLLPLALFAGPVYVAAGLTALLRRPLAYAVTAKGSLQSADSVRTPARTASSMSWLT